MARLFMTVIVSALALLPHGAVAEEARKPLMRKAMETLSTPESLPHGALAEEAPKPLMPLATAVWLVDNTALSFSQISQFCQLHELEVQSIADGEDAYKMQGLNPIASSQLTMDE